MYRFLTFFFYHRTVASVTRVTHVTVKCYTYFVCILLSINYLQGRCNTCYTKSKKYFFEFLKFIFFNNFKKGVTCVTLCLYPFTCAGLKHVTRVTFRCNSVTVVN